MLASEALRALLSDEGVIALVLKALFPSFLLSSASATKRNGLVYALWCFGGLAASALMFKGWQGAIANRDFVSLWVAGKLATSGHAAQAYDLAALRAAAHSLAGTTFNIAFPYPPHILFIAVPLSLLPLKFSFFLWQATSAALFYVAARPYVPKKLPRALVLLTPAAVINVTFGQVGFFYGALWLFAFAGSSVAAALLTFKPHLGVLIAAEVARRRHLLFTCLLAGSIICLSAMVFGLDAWRASILGAVSQQIGLLSSTDVLKWYYQMTTPYLGYGLIGWVAFAAAAVLLLVRNFNVFSAATAAFLIAPYGFHYDMTVVCLGFGILLFERWRSMPPWQTLACALAFLSPVLVSVGTWVVPPLLLAGLYIQCIQVRSQLAPACDLTDTANPLVAGR